MKFKSLLFTAVAFLMTETLLAQTWTAVASGTTERLNSVHFPTNTTGFAVGLNGTILKSTNGGNTWSDVSGGNYPGYFFWDVHFLDANNGFVVGESDPGNNPSGSGIILKTTNGGSTWSNAYTNSTTPFRDLFVVDNMVAYAAGGAENIMGAESRIVKTTDGGSTWTQMGSIHPGAGNAGVNIGGMYFTNATTGFMGEYSFLLSGVWQGTINSCASFTSVPAANSTPAYWRYSTDFSSSSTGYAIASSDYNDTVYLNKTTNGGITWTEGAIPNLAASILSIDCIGNSIYLSGYDGSGYIVKSTNGGTSFTEETIPSTGIMYDVFFPNENLGFAVGENGTILRFANVAGLDDALLAQVNLFPNPTNDLVYVDLSSLSNGATIRITDASGRICYEQFYPDSNQSKAILPVTTLAAGTYTVTIYTDNGITNRKLVKE